MRDAKVHDFRPAIVATFDPRPWVARKLALAAEYRDDQTFAHALRVVDVRPLGGDGLVAEGVRQAMAQGARCRQVARTRERTQ